MDRVLMVITRVSDPVFFLGKIRSRALYFKARPGIFKKGIFKIISKSFFVFILQKNYEKSPFVLDDPEWYC